MLTINRDDMLKLAMYLGQLPKNYKHFNMRAFIDVDLNLDASWFDGTNRYAKCRYEALPPSCVASHPEYLNYCGTAACAIGHAPLVPGVSVTPEEGESYFEYSWRFLTGLSNIGWGTQDEYRDIWKWCFGEQWETVDNTPLGAAQRIIHLLSLTQEEVDNFSFDDIYLDEEKTKYENIVVPNQQQELNTNV